MASNFVKFDLLKVVDLRKELEQRDLDSIGFTDNFDKLVQIYFIGK